MAAVRSPKTDDDPIVVGTRADMRLRGRIGGLATVARYGRDAIGARARSGFESKFLLEAGGDPVKAEDLRRMYYARLTRASVIARAKKKAPAVADAASALEVRSASSTTS